MAGTTNIPRRNPVRRVRANSTPAIPTVLPGTYETPSIERADISSLRGSRIPLSPLTSLSNQTVVSEALRPSLYSEVASRNTISSESSASDVNPSGLSNIFHSLSIQDGIPQDQSEVNEIIDVSAMNIDDGLWKEVRYGKRAQGPLTKAEPLSALRGEAMMLNNGQCHAVDAAEPSMTAEQLDRLARRMNTVSFKHGPLERSPSKEEGTSKRLGKTVDPRNWGAVDIEPDELDPEYQRQAFEFYSKFRTLQHERLLSTSDMEAHDPIEPLSDPEVWDNSKHAELDETPADSPALPLGFEGVACSEHEAVKVLLSIGTFV